MFILVFIVTGCGSEKLSEAMGTLGEQSHKDEVTINPALRFAHRRGTDPAMELELDPIDALPVELNNSKSPAEVKAIVGEEGAEKDSRELVLAGVTEKTSSVKRKPADKFKIDFAQRRAYLPGRGWIEEAQLWDIYLNRPTELPDEIDYEELHRFQQSSKLDVN